MARFNNNNNNSNNYFERNIKTLGRDFLVSKTPDQLKRDARSIFRDIAKGKVDVNKYEKYLTDTQLIHSCLAMANEKYGLHFWSQQGMECFIKTRPEAVNDYVIAVDNFHKATMNAYMIIIEHFKRLLEPNPQTGQRDIRNISSLAGQLRNYSFYV